MKIEVLNHASIKLIGDKIIYFDPYKVVDEVHDADYIFITHDHYDHYDIESINNIKKDSTKIIVPECLKDVDNNMVVDVDSEYEIDAIKFNTISSYNINKDYHPKSKKYVGYNVLLDGIYYYVMGDTDRTDEANLVKTDICFVPIGGTFTMDVEEASNYINYIRPKKAIPIHYGLIVGDKKLGYDFKDKIDKDIEVEVLI